MSRKSPNALVGEPAATPTSMTTEMLPGPPRLGVFCKKNLDRGFGFIYDGDGEEYFAHISAFAGPRDFVEIAEETGVSFRVSRTPKGLRALYIRPATVAEQVVIDRQEENRGNR